MGCELGQFERCLELLTRNISFGFFFEPLTTGPSNLIVQHTFCARSTGVQTLICFKLGE